MISYRISPRLMVLLTLAGISCSSPSEADYHDHNHDSLHDRGSSVDSLHIAATTHPVAVLDAHPVLCQGYVDAPPQARISIRVPIAGFVKQILPLPGELVKKGALLAELTHPDYLHLQEAYLVTKAEYSYQEQALIRQESLRGEEATTLREWSRASADFEISKANLASLAAKLAMLGIHPETLRAENLSSSIRIYSPRTAYVTSVQVSLGELAGPAQEICQLVVLEHMHFEAVIFEQDRHRVRVGQKVQFQVAGSDREYEGKVLLLGMQVESNDRGVRVHVEPSSEEGLIPGAFVKATILTEPDAAWLIPSESIHASPSGPVVHVSLGEDHVVVPLVGGRKTAQGLLLTTLPASLSADSELIIKEVAAEDHSH